MRVLFSVTIQHRKQKTASERKVLNSRYYLIL